MARGINKVILIGNLGRDPETRYTQAGAAVAHFSVATTEGWRDRQTGQQQERTEWHRVVCFARLAEIAGQYLRRGSKVYIEGGLRTSSWEQDGQTRYRTEIVAREFQMLDSRRSDAGPPQGGYEQRGSSSPGGYEQRASSSPGGYEQRGSAPQSPSRQAHNTPTLKDEDEDFDDDIPF